MTESGEAAKAMQVKQALQQMEDERGIQFTTLWKYAFDQMLVTFLYKCLSVYMLKNVSWTYKNPDTVIVSLCH